VKKILATNTRRRFVTISTCPEAWGGSEELWSRAVSILAERDHRVSVFKTTVDEAHPSIRRLKTLSCTVRDLERTHLPQHLINFLLPRRYQLDDLRMQSLFLALHLKARAPDLVIVSQGDNYDGLHFGRLCQRLKLPFILISQKATDHFWPPDKSRKYRREVFESALQCFFVSHHNQRLTEDQIGARLTNAAIVRNPFLVNSAGPVSWPGVEEKGFRLACVGRLYLLDKGQDVLLRVLAHEKWQNRNLQVSFFGEGINREGLEALATKLDVRKVSFHGHTNDVQSIWNDHHALIMASRTEGLPLTLVEAMLCGRTAIVTDVGGNREVLEDGVTGFLAAAASEREIDAALERAWQRRNEWQTMGLLAASRIRDLIPADPAAEFAQELLHIESRARKARSGQIEFSDNPESRSADEPNPRAGMTASD
jgi:glycosyltransferase involved in cell wall biosynthesis